MNNLLKLRKEAGLTTRKLQQLTDVSSCTITWLEKEKRPFRQIHLDRLSSFFSVTTDYLLGKSDKGYIVFLESGDQEITLSESEYMRLKPNINNKILRMSDNEQAFTVGGQTVFFPKFTIYRELKGDTKNLPMKQVLLKKIETSLKALSSEELEMVDKFMKDFIIRRK